MISNKNTPLPKMVDINVMSRQRAIEFFSTPHDNMNIAVISISNVDDYPPELKYFNEGLFLKFDDVEDGKNAITEEQAKSIAAFIKHPGIDLLVIHCGAGVSRSAAVAAAAMCYLWNDDRAIFDNGRYCPNMRCYRSVLNALFPSPFNNDEYFSNKEKESIEAWKKKNDYTYL